MRLHENSKYDRLHLLKFETLTFSLKSHVGWLPEGSLFGKNATEAVQLSVEMGLRIDMLFGSQPVGKIAKDCFVVHMYMQCKLWLQREH